MLKFLENLFSYADWISPLSGIIEDVARGGDLDSHTFVFNLNEAVKSGWSPFQIVWLLNAKGIKTHGTVLPHGPNFQIKVSVEQRDYAEYVMSASAIKWLENPGIF